MYCIYRNILIFWILCTVLITSVNIRCMTPLNLRCTELGWPYLICFMLLCEYAKQLKCFIIHNLYIIAIIKIKLLIRWYWLVNGCNQLENEFLIALGNPLVMKHMIKTSVMVFEEIANNWSHCYIGIAWLVNNRFVASWDDWEEIWKRNEQSSS